MRCELKILLACFLAALMCAIAPLYAATPVNIQTCTLVGPPLPSSLLGCAPPHIVFTAVGPTTLVRSIVGGSQGWRAFSTLTPADSVVSATDAAWHPLSSITVALLPTSTPTPPAIPPPVVTPPTQSVVITSTDNPQLVVTFTGVPNPGCFTVNAKQVCVP